MAEINTEDFNQKFSSVGVNIYDYYNKGAYMAAGVIIILKF